MKSELIKKQVVAKDTMSFEFSSPIASNHLPGQYIYLTLTKLKYEDPKGPTRDFTIAGSPTENKLMIATRIRKDSGFKNTLKEMEIGDFVEIEGPNGSFVLDEKMKGNHLILAGGIGITPFRSIIKYNIDKKTENKIFLLFANSTPEEIPFKNELESWSKNKNFSLAMTVSKPDENWKGLTGRIDENMIKNQIKSWGVDIKSLTFWLCGPPVFVDAMEKILETFNIPFGKVKTEKFSGY